MSVLCTAEYIFFFKSLDIYCELKLIYIYIFFFSRVGSRNLNVAADESQKFDVIWLMVLMEATYMCRHIIVVDVRFKAIDFCGFPISGNF